MKTVKIIDVGNNVACDLCNDDYTNSEETGGVLVDDMAVCPKCIGKAEGCEIQAQCPPGMRFNEWVLALRGGDNTIKIMSE